MIVTMASRALGTPEPAAYTVLATQDADAVKPWTVKQQFLATLVVYLLLFLLDRIQIYSLTATGPEQFLDAATVLFPHLSGSPPRALQSRYFVGKRPDIQSWMFDLGGSTCACTLQWDQTQYWQRLLYGKKYVLAHVMTAFTGPFFVPCWEWNVLYKVLNEVLEELALPVNGKWAGTGVPMDMEPRYDSLLNDLTLGGFVFIIMASHAVYVLGLPSIAEYNLQWDIQSFKVLFTAFFQYYTLQSVQTLWKNFGMRTFRLHVFGLSYFPGYMVAFIFQIAYLRLLWLMRAWPTDTYNKTVGLLVLLWTPFVFFTELDNYHEQIRAILSFALTGISVSAFQCHFNVGNQKVMAFASICYGCALLFYVSLQIGPIVAVPEDQFYTKHYACGINNQSVTDSCQWLTQKRIE